jgi:phosphoglycerol transferase MdoB-like AlkP superfamily enzyme
MKGSGLSSWNPSEDKPLALPQWTVPYLSSLTALALFWAVENFLVQAAAFDQQPTTLHPHFYQTIRLGLNFLAAAAVLLFFGRRWLLAILAGDFLVSVLTLPYAQYFHHALSLEATMRTADEGMRVSHFGLEVIPPALWLALLGALAVKVYWVIRITPQPASWRRGCAAACLAAEMACILGLQFTSFRLPSLRSRSVTRAVYAYGYLNAWAAELFYGPDMKEISQQLIELQSASPDRLLGVEEPWPVSSHVVVVQMESIGWEVLNARIAGQEVAPFLSSLACSSRCFRIQVYHTLGSADMDYAVLSGGTPSSAVVSYDVPDVTYSNGLPGFMEKHGFHTVALHGNDGGFFNRRGNFERMGFDEIWFKEDFKGRAVKQSSWGVRDAELFQLSSREIRQAARPQFHFIITLDSHAPFNLIDDQEKKVFPNAWAWRENYFNSARRLDELLRDYIQSLPPGTLVILYGDHPAGVDYEGFHPAQEGSAEFVPCLVHVCGDSSAPAAHAWPPASLPPDLRILDIINFMRHQIADRPAPAPPPYSQSGLSQAVPSARRATDRIQ